MSGVSGWDPGVRGSGCHTWPGEIPLPTLPSLPGRPNLPVCLPLLHLSDGRSHLLLFTLPTGHVGLEHISSLVTVDECSSIKISSHPHTRLQSKIICVFSISFIQERLC